VTWGYAKDIHKKREKKVKKEKIDKCPRYLKQWELRCSPDKKEDK
jgi:hypothetical protein